MTEELYFYKLVEGVKTNYTLIDIDKVDIVRTYTSPYFSDIERLKNNGTYTIKLPQTINNKAFFENCHRSDTTSELPYDYLYADYFYNGLTVFLNAEVKVLDTVLFYEVQCVYGVNRLKYLPLFEKNLNEIVIDGINITVDDWIVNWNRVDMFVSGKKYKYLNTISGKRVLDQETINGIIQPVLLPDEPAKSNMKEMTMHPFVLSENILDLIITDCDISDFDVDDLKSKLTNKGIILNTLNEGYLSNGYLSVNFTDWDAERDVELQGISYDYEPIYVGNEAIKYIVGLKNNFVYGKKITLNLNCTVSGILTSPILKIKLYKNNEIQTIDIPYSYLSNVFTYTLTDYELDIENGLYFKFEFDAIPLDGEIITLFDFRTDYQFNKPFFGYYPTAGFYDCVANMPKITEAEFIQQMLIHTCGFLGYDNTGELKTFFFDEFVANLNNGNVYDWSNRYSGLRKSSFQFNDHAQKNYIKFANDKDLTNRNEYVTVNDKTIASEKDLYTLKLDSPLGGEGEKSDYILYEQTVKRSGTDGVSFENKYVGDKWQAAFVIDDNGTAKNINVIDGNYATYQKLIERPIVYECDLNLSVYESANIDFAKPVYIDVIGKYCLLLELQAPNNELCAAKLLLINQTL